MGRIARSLSMLVAVLVACYSAAAPVCDLSCSFMQLRSTCGDSGAAQSSSIPKMNISGDRTMDMPGMAMPDAAPAPANSSDSQQADRHLPNHPEKLPSSCIHSSCAQASVSSNSKIIHRDMHSTLLGVPCDTIAAPHSSAAAYVTPSPPETPPLLSTSSPLRI
jgi:hypothetical protein